MRTKEEDFNRRFRLIYLVVFLAVSISFAQQSTYCNPLDLDYTYMIYNAHKDLSYRSGADPAVVQYQGDYYMFVTRSHGYWYSKDLGSWEFIEPENWYFEGSNAPAAFNYKDSLLYVAGNPSGSMSIIYSDDPRKGKWKATPAILNDLQDPALFIDDDGGAYIFWGSSNKFPIRAKSLDRTKRFRPSEETHELFNLQPEKHGWERFGENHSDTILGGYIEGPWITKHKNRYYLQYAAPGTEFNVYGDGVYVAGSPLGPYEYAAHNPFSYKPGGFITGAGHGSTVSGPGGQYWHLTTMAVNVNIGWERRIGMFPAYFDEDGLLYSNTAYGDYPHYAPGDEERRGEFTGWMLLSYGKPVKVSSALQGFEAEKLTDENIKTFWVAATNDDSQWVELDLQERAAVYAIQLNFNDYESGLYGRVPGLYHRFLIEGSEDGKSWSVLADRSKSTKDSPNAYIQLPDPRRARYIRYRNIHIPTPQLSLSDFRIFGKGEGKAPGPVKSFRAERRQDRRDISLHWDKVKDAIGYTVYWGISPDKLYSSWQLYEDTMLEIKSLNTDQDYYFAIEAFNGNGISTLSKPVYAK